VRKIADVRPMPGLFVEIALLTPPSVAYLLWLASRGEGGFGSAPAVSLLLAAAGPVTVGPLLMFNDGIRKLTLATVGFLQYMTPTGHFILAVTVFGEPFDLTRLAAFAFIWTALGIYTFDLRRRLARPGA
jgi:chloramphenicol-sensitive protein RarD